MSPSAPFMAKNSCGSRVLISNPEQFLHGRTPKKSTNGSKIETLSPKTNQLKSDPYSTLAPSVEPMHIQVIRSSVSVWYDVPFKDHSTNGLLPIGNTKNHIIG